jgi:hypothetical protein
VQVSEAQQQWWGFKSDNFDSVLLFKVGKFYEVRMQRDFRTMQAPQKRPSLRCEQHDMPNVSTGLGLVVKW